MPGSSSSSRCTQQQRSGVPANSSSPCLLPFSPLPSQDSKAHSCLCVLHLLPPLPQVVVLAAAGLEEAKRVDALCHAQGIKFVWAQSRGVFASVFTDFGPEFTVFDVDGEWMGGWKGAGILRHRGAQIHVALPR